MNKTKTPEPPVLDEALLDRARAGDREALTVLYEATSLEVYRTVHALVRDEDLTLDIQQDAYLQAFSHLDQLREATAFLPWLRQIAVNAARAQLRKKRPLLFTELGGDPEADTPELPDPRPEDSPELALDRKENARLIREILGELSDGQRLLLGMYYYEQMSVREIAEKLELSPGTVKAQLYRGRKRVEDRVRWLEEQGVRLFGLSPLPFLLALLRRQEPGPETAGRTMAAVLPETVAVHTGRSFFQTLLGRVCLGLLTVSVIAGGVLGWRWIRDRAELGDYQPPETLDTAEDLIPETTEPVVTWDDTPEDLTTEPVTEPEPAEPEPTEPATEPSAAPSPSSPAAPNPAPIPTEPAPSQPETSKEPEKSEFVRWCWNGSSKDAEDIYHEEPPIHGSHSVLTAYVRGEAVPQLVTDNPQAVSLKPAGVSLEMEGLRTYAWEIYWDGPGVARLSLILEGETVASLTVTNPEFAPHLISAEVWNLESVNDTFTQLKVGDAFIMSAEAEYCEGVYSRPDIYIMVRTDREDILRARNGSDNSCSVCWWFDVIGSGTAHLYVSLGDTVVKTFTFIVPEEEP